MGASFIVKMRCAKREGLALLACFTLAGCATGVRPSPGAGGSKGPAASEFREASGSSDVAERRAERTPITGSGRAFDFQKDTFSFPNELLWIYEYNAYGKWTTRPRFPKPQYWQHCMLMAQATKQFFCNVRFDPAQPVADRETYRRLIRRVIKSNARRSLPEGKKIVIPGYRDLRQFSAEQEPLLKEGLGGGWRSYFQRGHWRVVFPFLRAEQKRTAEHLLVELQSRQPRVMHLVLFPQLTINHAVIFFDAEETPKEIRFSLYDPNQPSIPRTIIYKKPKRTFYYPANNYFPGGRVNIYEIYRGLLY